MGMNDMLRKMAVLLERRQDALFSYDVSKQKKYIAKLGNHEMRLKDRIFSISVRCSLMEKESLFC